MGTCALCREPTQQQQELYAYIPVRLTSRKSCISGVSPLSRTMICCRRSRNSATYGCCPNTRTSPCSPPMYQQQRSSLLWSVNLPERWRSSLLLLRRGRYKFTSEIFHRSEIQSSKPHEMWSRWTSLTTNSRPSES